MDPIMEEFVKSQRDEFDAFMEKLTWAEDCILKFLGDNFNLKNYTTLSHVEMAIQSISWKIKDDLLAMRPREVKAEKISAKLRKRVMERDKYKCQVCKTHLNLSIDHTKPVSKGGTNDIGNLRTLCKPCNSSKRDRKAVL